MPATVFSLLEKRRAHLRPEDDFILSGARVAMDAKAIERARALLETGDLDWPYILKKTQAEGVGFLLYHSLEKSLPPHAAPADVFETLRTAYHSNVIRNMGIASNLREILLLLESENIAVLPYKGPLLGQAVYGNMGLRLNLDLDIVVPKMDAVRSARLLERLGYRAPEFKSEKEAARHIDSLCHYKLKPPRKAPPLEVHWEFVSDHFTLPIDLERMRRRAGRVSLSGVSLPHMHPEDTLIVLCVHLAKHCSSSSERLRWICDLAEAPRAYPDFDWESLMSQARAIGLGRFLSLGLLSASVLLDARIPEEVLAPMRGDRALVEMTADVVENLFGSGPAATRTSHLRFFMKARERMRDKVKFGANVAWRVCKKGWYGIS